MVSYRRGLDAAFRAHEEVIEILEWFTSAAPEDHTARLDHAGALAALGGLRAQQGDPAMARTELQASIDVFARAADDCAAAHRHDRDALASYAEVAARGRSRPSDPEAIDFNGRSITVRAAAGPATTIIDATGLDASVVTIASNESATTRLEGFRLTGGTGTPSGAFTEGGGMRIRQSSPTIRDCVIVGNEAQFGGGVHVGYETSGIRFEACLILDNLSTLGGGGGIHHFGPELVVDRCRILGNVAEFGGGVLSYGPGTTLIANSLISGNRATGSFCCFGNGGGGYNANQGRETQLVNVTFAGNTATASSGSRGGAVHIQDDVSPAMLTNCLFHENDDTMGFTDVSDPFAAATVSHCLLQQSWGGAGGSNLVTESFLIDPDGVDNVYGTPDDNPNLAPGSACTEAGDASALPAGFDTCLVGNPRVINLIDIGAMEYPDPPCTADIDGSGTVDFTDLLTLLSSWGACGGCPADLDHDDMVGFSDLLAVLQAWGPCA